MRITTLAAAACLLASSSAPAGAQAEVLMFGLCRKLPDDVARLKCFDAIGAAIDQRSKAEPAPPIVREWIVSTDKSPVDDSPQADARLRSEDGEAWLMIRCMERKIEAVVRPKGLFISSSSGGKVLLRLNDLPAASATWTASSDSQAVFAPNGSSFLKMLPDNGTLFVRVTGYNNQSDATFKLGAVSAIRDQIVAACKGPSAKGK
jgi:hypothetical protein